MATIFSDPQVQALATAIDQELASIERTRSSSVQRSLEEPNAPLAKTVLRRRLTATHGPAYSFSYAH